MAVPKTELVVDGPYTPGDEVNLQMYGLAKDADDDQTSELQLFKEGDKTEARILKNQNQRALEIESD